jgi:hypothetical protein
MRNVERLQHALAIVVAVNAELQRHVHDAEAPPCHVRDALRYLFWRAVTEDADAVALLVRNRRLVAARTLLRPQFESLARAAWISVCGEGPCHDASAGVRWPRLANAVGYVVRHPHRVWGDAFGYPFDMMMRRLAVVFHDGTHRGRAALQRLNHQLKAAPTQIAPDEVSILSMSTVMAVHAAGNLLVLCGDQERAKALVGLCDLALGGLGRFDLVDEGETGPKF